MEGHLLMSRRELGRKSVLELVMGGQISLVEASYRRGLSYRQTLRVYALTCPPERYQLLS